MSALAEREILEMARPLAKNYKEIVKFASGEKYESWLKEYRKREVNKNEEVQG